MVFVGNYQRAGLLKKVGAPPLPTPNQLGSPDTQLGGLWIFSGLTNQSGVFPTRMGSGCGFRLEYEDRMTALSSQRGSGCQSGEPSADDDHFKSFSR